MKHKTPANLYKCKTPVKESIKRHYAQIVLAFL